MFWWCAYPPRNDGGKHGLMQSKSYLNCKPLHSGLLRNRKFTFQGLMPCTAFCGIFGWKARQDCPAFQIDMAQRPAGGRTCWKVNLRLMNDGSRHTLGRCCCFLSVAQKRFPSFAWELSRYPIPKPLSSGKGLCRFASILIRSGRANQPFVPYIRSLLFGRRRTKGVRCPR